MNKDYEVIQVRNGMQTKKYGDHIWAWDIITDNPYEEVLKYCQENLKKAEREEQEYWKERRASMSFEKTMELVCGGYYKLTKINNGYQYKVVNEYID